MKPIPGYPCYMVNEDGEVFTQHNNRYGASGVWKKMTPMIVTYKKCSYYCVELRENGQRFNRKVHCLVMLAYHGQPSDGQVVRHLDGNGLNCKLSNLCYGTRSENESDKVRHGTSNRGERNGHAKLTADKVREIRALRGTGLTHQAIAERYGIKRKGIGDIINRKLWKHVA